jgi:hypothetical protein
MFQDGNRVEFVGEDLPDEFVYRGHPGQFWGCNTLPPVTLVNGPSLDFRAGQTCCVT